MPAMVEVPKAPENEVISEHEATGLIYDPSFFGIEALAGHRLRPAYSGRGRTLQRKRGFYRQMVEQLHSLGMRHEDAFLNQVGTGHDDWSFGDGASSLVQP